MQSSAKRRLAESSRSLLGGFQRVVGERERGMVVVTRKRDQKVANEEIRNLESCRTFSTGHLAVRFTRVHINNKINDKLSL